MNDRHIATVLALHFDPDQGSPYWLQRQQQLGFDVRREIRGHADFHRLGPMDVSALRTRPLTDFIPRALHRELATMLLSETGGTTGDPCRRVFSPREFDSAFIAPWLKAVAEHGFPRQGCWLFVGPGGPHIIDRSARGPSPMSPARCPSTAGGSGSCSPRCSPVLPMPSCPFP